MGTRSLTTIVHKYENFHEKIVTMYRQMDGYMEGHGFDLADFLSKGKLVNGISLDKTEHVFNGSNCLAAQIVAHFKDGPGGIYLHNPEAKNMGEEYHYHILSDEKSGKITLECYGVGNKENELLFIGTPKQFLKKLKYKENGKA